MIGRHFRSAMPWPALAIALALVAGCGTTTPSRFYTLSATATPTAARSTLQVAVGPVTVPAVVDRPEFVVSNGRNEVRLDEFNRWAAPLQDSLSSVVAENLAAILGTPQVVRFPQALATDPDYRVVVEVRSFESMPGTGTALDAVWTIRRAKDGKSSTGRTSAREAVAQGGYDALAAAHSRSVARLSQDIADALGVLERSPR